MIGQKFVYASVDNTVKSRELKEAVDLLETAGVLTRIKRSNGDGLPLEANVKENYFKLLFLDIGLLHNMNGIYGETMLQEDLASVFRGAVAEQFVGQELLVLQSPLTKAKLYYWAREAKNSSAEIDYLIAIKGKVIPIEVKSGKTNKMISLRLFMQQYQSSIGIKISQQEYMEKDDILAIPFYGMPVLFTELYE
jgi:predicted AAA+ superfamily ATPase